MMLDFLGDDFTFIAVDDDTYCRAKLTVIGWDNASMRRPGYEMLDLITGYRADVSDRWLLASEDWRQVERDVRRLLAQAARTAAAARQAGPVRADPALAHEAGFRLPVYLSPAAWDDCVRWTDQDAERTGWPQNETGRLWDVLVVALGAEHELQRIEPRVVLLSNGMHAFVDADDLPWSKAVLGTSAAMDTQPQTSLAMASRPCCSCTG